MGKSDCVNIDIVNSKSSIRSKTNNENIKMIKFSLMIYVCVFLVMGLALAIPGFHTSDTTSRLYEDSDEIFIDDYSLNVDRDNNDISDNTLTYKLLNIKKVSDIDVSNNGDFDVLYDWFNLDNNGKLTINPSRDVHAGEYKISVFVGNGKSLGESRSFNYIINKVNDKPRFTNIEDGYQMVEGKNFLEYINAVDEEEHYPLLFEISFLDNCVHGKNSEKNDCKLFDFVKISDTLVKMDFNPTRDDIGVYYANISVSDNGKNFVCEKYCESSYSQNKKTYYSEIVVFEVLSKAESIEKILLSPIEDIRESTTKGDIIISFIIAIVIFVLIMNFGKSKMKKQLLNFIKGKGTNKNKNGRKNNKKNIESSSKNSLNKPHSRDDKKGSENLGDIDKKDKKKVDGKIIQEKNKSKKKSKKRRKKVGKRK